MKVDYRTHVVLYALIIIPALVLIISSSSIFADAVPGGGGGGSVYTETWTVSTTTTTNSSATNTSKQKLVYTVDGEDVLISVVIGGTSILIGRMSNSPQKKKRESEPVRIASDLDLLAPEMRQQILNDIRKELDRQRKDYVLDDKRLKERLQELENLRISPHFSDAIQILKDMGEDLTLDDLQEKVKDLQEISKELGDLKQCPKCDKPVQAATVKTEFGGDLRQYRHDGGSGHSWYVSVEKDMSALDHWRVQRNLPTMYTHCNCAHCNKMHRRKDMNYSNGWFQRNFGMGPKFKCQNPKCGQEQWVPKTNSWKDDTVDLFVR